MLGAPPPLEPTPPVQQQGGGGGGAGQLEEQLNGLRSSVSSLQEQIRQSESNLTAQWTALQQQQRQQVEGAVHAAQGTRLERISKEAGLPLVGLDTLLQPILDTCTKDSISAGKSWIFQTAVGPDTQRLVAEHLVWRVTQPGTAFTQRLHLVYLVNDVLHHCVRKGAGDLQAALEAVAVPLYCAAATVAGETEIGKLTKLISLWEDKNKFFSEETIQAMKEPERSLARYKEELAEQYREAAEEVEKTVSATFAGYKQQHQQFVDHANGQVEQQQRQVEDLETRLGRTTPAPAPPGRRSSRWDRAAPGSAPPPAVDVTRPPPGFAPAAPAAEPEPTRPTVPYYDLPAGLMVPLVKQEDSGYRPLDPALIRLPPPQPPSERLLAAVELFYSGPSHERPRDTEGWEKLGLYEWSRDKQAAIRRKQEDIESGARARSPSPPSEDRESSPEQTVPGGKREARPRVKKRYRSRSRSKSRTRSGSRGSTPPRSGGRAQRSPSPEQAVVAGPGGGQLDNSNKGHQMLARMGWRGAGLGATEAGITQPVEAAEPRDKGEYRGMGVQQDPFESFRKQKAGSFYTRMQEIQDERSQQGGKGGEAGQGSN